MKIVKFTKALPGPTITSPLLKEAYNFAHGVCALTDNDADTLLVRCRDSFKQVDYDTFIKSAGSAVAGNEKPVLESAEVYFKTLILDFDEDLALAPVAKADLTVKVNTVTVDIEQVYTGAKQVIIHLMESVGADTTVTISYGAVAIKDILGNAADAKTDQAVTNETPEPIIED